MHLEGLRPAERDVRVKQDLLLLDEAESGKAAGKTFQRNRSLHAPERGADAEVDPAPERKRPARVLALGVEAVGIDEHRGIASRRREPKEQLRAGGQIDAPERDRLLGDAPPDGNRGVE